MDGETGQTNFFDFDLSGYDFYGMTNEEIQDLFNKFNSELGIKQSALEIKVNGISNKVYKSIDNLRTDLQTLSSGFDKLDELNTNVVQLNKNFEGISKQLQFISVVGLTITIALGLLVGAVFAKSVWTNLR